jgi:hypothetical protein
MLESLEKKSSLSVTSWSTLSVFGVNEASSGIEEVVAAVDGAAATATPAPMFPLTSIITIDTASGINAVVITKLFDEEVLIEVIKLNPIPITKAAAIMIMNSFNPTIPLTKIESNI